VKKVLLIWVLMLATWVLPGTVVATTSPVQGYAWSANVGWVSFNCTNSQTCGSVNYGVNLDRDSGAVSGYAWNNNVGWISFNAGDTSGCPLSSCNPKVVDGKLIGWARVLAHGEGWDGWIHLSGSNYGVSFDNIRFSGYSWSDEVMGWMNWRPALGPGVFSVGEHKLSTGLSGGIGQVYVESDVCSQTSCVFSYEDATNLTLVANPKLGYLFDKWTGADASLCSSLASRICADVKISEDIEIKAVFKTDPDPIPPPEALPQCNNCIDDNGDGKFDWLDDPACRDPEDPTETKTLLSVDLLLEPGTDGKVVSTPADIDCGTTCSKMYYENGRVTLTAIPLKPNTVFQKWGGAVCVGSNPTCIVNINIDPTKDQELNATAYFGKGPIFLPECSDGVDNDADNKTDYGEDPGCDSPDDDSEIDVDDALCPTGGPGLCPECNDGVDNDGDNSTDYPDDPECSSLLDNSESILGVNCPADGPGKCPQCNDGIDNTDPEDRIADFNPDPARRDPGCFSYVDNNEVDPVILGNCPADGPGKCPQCNDGVDNDKDNTTDWNGWDADKDRAKIKEVPRDTSCQGEPNKNSEAGGIDVIEI